VKLRTEAPVNGGRNYNGPKVRFASLSKIWLYAGRSEYPTLREAIRVTMRWVQIISRKGHRRKISDGILRDYMPDSNEMFLLEKI
jgi:hypothetical protein